MQEGYSAEEIASALLAHILYTPDAPSSSSEDTFSKMPTKVSPDDFQNASMVKLHLNLGKRHKIRIKDIVGSIAGECGIPGSALGHIDILETFSFVEIPSSLAAEVIEIMNGNEIKGKKVKIELAEKR